MAEIVTHGFEPVYNKDCRVLVLGSLPSVKSRENGFYYGHPRNRFWLVLSKLFESELPLTVSEKTELLLKHRIAVFDVVKSCEIESSKDSSIKIIEANDILPIVEGSNISKIFANGRTAERLYNRYILPETGIGITALPSTSPANAAYSVDRLLDEWKIIKEEAVK